jgi:hypothetical protein
MRHCDRSGRLGRRLGWTVLPLILLSVCAPFHSALAGTRPASPAPPTGGDGPQFSVIDGRARLEAENAKLSDILAAITARTGITAVLDPEADRSVSISVRDIAVSDALRYLLRDLNVAEVWVPAPRGLPPGEIVLAKLYIYPEGKSAPGNEPLVIGGGEGTGKPDYIVRSLPSGNDRPREAKPDDSYYASVAAVKAYQKKKALKSALFLSRMAREDAGSSPDSPMMAVDPDQMKAYLEKKAMLKAKSPSDYGAAGTIVK